MKIMYINDTGFDTGNSNNHLVLSMLLRFLEDGNNVYYVGSHSTGSFDDIPKEFEKYDSFTYDIIQKPLVKRSNLVKRYLTAIKYERQAKKRWKRRIADIDIVVVQSHYTAYFTFKFLKKYKKKTVFNIYDIFPGTTYEASGIGSRIVYKLFLKLQRFIYKTVTCIFTLTEDTRKSLIELGVKEEKIYIVPNWFDSEKIERTKYDNFLKEYSLNPDKKYVQYAGQIGVSYDFDFIIRVAESLKDRKDIIFEFVGDGLKLPDIQNKVKEKKLDNIVFIRWQPLEKLSEVYSSCTIQMVPLRKDIIFNSYPSKILPLMGCKRTAVISVEDNSSFYKEMNDNHVAYCVPLNDVNAFKEAIVELCDNDSLRERYETNAYHYVMNRFKANTNVDKMLTIFQNILEE